jgi:hypothetical protein
MDALPLPPEPLLSPAGDPGGALGRPPRPGDLTTTWRTLFAVGWAGVVMGVAAVLKTSRTMGLATWWLGPEADPTIVFVEALPFVPPVLLIVAAFRGVRHLPYYGLLGGVAMAAIATGDLGRFGALAAVEFGVAVIGLLVSIASFAGMLRPAEPLVDVDVDGLTEAVGPDEAPVMIELVPGASEPTN